MSSYVPTASIRPSACSTAPSSTTTISRSLRALHKTNRPRTSDAFALLGPLPSPVPFKLLRSVTAQPLRLDSRERGGTLRGGGNGLAPRGKHEQIVLQVTWIVPMACTPWPACGPPQYRTC